MDDALPLGMGRHAMAAWTAVALCVCGLIGARVLTSGQAQLLPAPTHVGQPRYGWDRIASTAAPTSPPAKGRGDTQHAMRRVAGGSLATSAGGVSATFSVGGVLVRAGSRDTLQLGLARLGRMGRLQQVERVSPSGRANEVRYVHRSVVEWYTRGPLGLEQEFTLSRRPAGTGALTLVVGRIPSRETVVVAPDGRSLSIQGRLSVGSLSVTDRFGRRLPAWLAVTHRMLTLKIDDSSARYPLRVDPTVTAQAELTASDGTTSGYFGGSVGVSGSTIVIGTGFPGWVGPGPMPRAAYVFAEPNGGAWQSATQTAELTVGSGAGGTGLGNSVAIDANTIVVSGTGAVAAYVYAEPAGGWQASSTPDAVLTVQGLSGFAAGDPVKISGGTIVVGDPGANAGQGAAYVFSEPPGGWASENQAATLTASDGASQDAFGSSVGVSGSAIVVGAPDHGVGSNIDQGAAYVFSEGPSGWITSTESAELTASNGAQDDWFGSSVSIDASTIAIGADTKNHSNVGAIYVFQAQANSWATATQTAELTASDNNYRGWLGQAVAIQGNTIFAPVEVLNLASGAALDTFVEPVSGGWKDATQSAELTTGGSGEGTPSVAISGNTVVIGQSGTQVGLHAAQGAAFVDPSGVISLSGGGTSPPIPPPSGGGGGSTSAYPGVSIDGGDVATNSLSVQLSITPLTGATQASVSNDAGMVGSDTQTLSVGPQVQWTLATPPTDVVTLLVYARFVGAYDWVQYSASIIYDSALPTVQSASVTSAGSAVDVAGAARAGLRSYSLRLKAKDPHVGVCEIATATRRNARDETVTSIKSCKRIGVTHLSTVIRLRLAGAPKYVRVRNSAGSWSHWLAITP